jgi:hypothetical protein
VPPLNGGDAFAFVLCVFVLGVCYVHNRALGSVTRTTACKEEEEGEEGQRAGERVRSGTGTDIWWASRGCVAHEQASPAGAQRKDERSAANGS